nr:unnamed protein product [Digitaria exilis]
MVMAAAAANGGSSTRGKPIKCKAAVAWAPGEPLVMEQVEVAPPGRLEVRVKVIFTSICHTDLSAWKGENEMQRKFPRILGHEAVGFSVVDRSSGELRPVYHFLNTSTFTEYTVLDAACAVQINPKAPMEKMYLLSCGISTGVGAAWNTANISKGSTVAVFGLGAVGLAVAEGARLRGAARIIGVDINPEKFSKGKEMGVTDFINSKACGKPVHEGWGLTVVLGIHATPKMMPLHPMELFDGRRITGCVFGDFKGKSQLPELVDKCINGVELFLHRIFF